MADPFNTPVGQSVLQGAQVFNQSVQVFLQDQRARQQLKLRQQELDDLAKLREQKLKAEEDKLKIDREKFTMEQEMHQARLQLMQEQAQAIPRQLSIEEKRAGVYQQRAGAYQARTEANIIKQMYDTELKGAKNQWERLHTTAVDSVKFPEEIKHLERVPLEDLDRMMINIQSDIQKTMGQDTIFKEDQRARVATLQTQQRQIAEAKKLVGTKIRELLKADSGIQKEPRERIEGVLDKYLSGSSVTPLRTGPPQQADVYKFQFPEYEDAARRGQAIIEELKRMDWTPERLSETDMETLADEIYAIRGNPDILKSVTAALAENGNARLLRMIYSRLSAKVSQ